MTSSQDTSKFQMSHLLILLHPWRLSIIIIFFFFLCTNLLVINGDVGTAAEYSPPYLPTACYGNDVTQFPTNNLFASASEGIWDNGASCGRQYLVRCLSSLEPGTCTPDTTIQVTIVDRTATLVSSPSSEDTTMVLSESAFGLITLLSSTTEINIEFQQV